MLPSRSPEAIVTATPGVTSDATPHIDDQPGPSFPMYARDWLTGQGTTRMTAEQKGAFIELLCHAWLSRPACTLPDDDVVLARLSGLGKRRWNRVGGLIRDQFPVSSDGLLRNRKQQQVYRELLGHRAHRSELGRKGADARWGRHADAMPTHSGTTAWAMPEPMPQPMPARWPASASASAFAEEERSRADVNPSDREPRRRSAGVLAGALPRDHRNHEACDESHSRCVPRAVHHKLANALAPRHGGDRAAAAEALRDWYPKVWATLPADFVMPDAFDFWCGRFNATFASKDTAGGNGRGVPSAEQTSTERVAESRRIAQLAQELEESR